MTFRPVLPFLVFFFLFGKRQGKPPKKTRMFHPYRTPKIPGKSSTARLRIWTLRIWGFRGPGFRSARQVLCGDASRLFLYHFSKHLSSVSGRTELCHEVRNPGPQKPQIIRNENHHLALPEKSREKRSKKQGNRYRERERERGRIPVFQFTTCTSWSETTN